MIVHHRPFEMLPTVCGLLADDLEMFGDTAGDMPTCLWCAARRPFTWMCAGTTAWVLDEMARIGL